MSRMPSTSTGTVSEMPGGFGGPLDLDAQRVGLGRQHEGKLGEHRQRDRLARQLDVAADQPDELLLEQVVDDQSPVVDRLGDDGLRELAVDQLGEEPLRRTLVHAQPHARRALAQVGDERRDQPPARGTDHAEARRSPPRAPGAARGRRASPRARGAPDGPARARASPNSVGSAPLRLRTSSGTPSSASSWRTWSDTFDCTVASASAAAVNDPSSSIASSVSRCRSSMVTLPEPVTPFPGHR